MPIAKLEHKGGGRVQVMDAISAYVVNDALIVYDVNLQALRFSEMIDGIDFGPPSKLNICPVSRDCQSRGTVPGYGFRLVSDPENLVLTRNG